MTWPDNDEPPDDPALVSAWAADLESRITPDVRVLAEAELVARHEEDRMRQEQGLDPLHPWILPPPAD